MWVSRLPSHHGAAVQIRKVSDDRIDFRTYFACESSGSGFKVSAASAAEAHCTPLMFVAMFRKMRWLTVSEVAQYCMMAQDRLAAQSENDTEGNEKSAKRARTDCVDLSKSD